MIVESMNYKEISNALVSDYNYIVNRRLDRLGEKYNRARRKNKISNQREYSKIYEFQTPQKNNWILLLSKAPSVRSYKGSSTIVIAFLCYYYTSIGIRVFKIIPTGGFSVFNSHFFTRYNERLNLGLVDPMDKVKHYFTHNGYSHSKAIKNDGKMYLVGTVKDGYILGEVQHEIWAVFKTFISNDMSTDDQNEIEKSLNDSLQDQLEQLLNEEQFDKEDFDYKADVKAALNSTNSNLT